MNKLFCLMSLLFLYALGQGQPVSNRSFGNNANYTRVVGVDNNAGGKLDNFWGDPQGSYAGQANIYKKSESGIVDVRYSGIVQENNFLIDGLSANDPATNLYLTKEDYIAKAKRFYDNGQVPMLMMPLNDGYEADWPNNLADGATQVAKLVKAVNEGLVDDGYLAVTHWLYPNEPNLPFPDGSHGFIGSGGADEIHDYIEAFYNAVYGSGNTCWDAAWGTPVFIGPDLAWFENKFYAPGTGLVDLLIEDDNNYVNSTCILPYIDVFSYHYYPFGDESTTSTNDNYFLEATRANVIDILRNRIKWKNTSYQDRSFIEEIDYLQGKLATYQNSTNGHPISVSINEANICHSNDVNGDNATFTDGDAITGTGANSYMASQFWADLLAVCMEKQVWLNFWSSLEGVGPDYETNLGFLNGDPNKFGASGGLVGQKKPTYHHFQMMAQNYQGGTFYTTQKTVGSDNNIKVFSGKDVNGRYVITIMNQNEEASNTPGTLTNTTIGIGFGVSPNGAETYKFQTAFSFPSAQQQKTYNIPKESTYTYVYNPDGTLYKKLAEARNGQE